jgi:DNA-binding NtrC family response regulator
MNDSGTKASRRRILIVDGDVQLRAVLVWMLSRAGYEVRHASNGHEATALHRRDPFDVIIVDMVLPEKEGFEALAQLAAEASPPKFITASSEGLFPTALYFRTAENLGAHRALAKPFQSEQLLAAVQDALREN